MQDHRTKLLNNKPRKLLKNIFFLSNSQIQFKISSKGGLR